MADDEWIEIRRFVDATSAEMTRDFLEEHDIPVRLRGNTGATSVLNRFTTVIDTRLDVRQEDLAEAREALEALDAPESVAEEPFRGRRTVDTKEEADGEEPYVAPKKISAAMMLGFVVPIGAGHFYARHSAMGTVILAGMVAAILGTVLGRPYLGLAWGILALADIALSPFAVRRYNANKIPSEPTQRIYALVLVAVAFAAAFVIGAY